jgi:hypothetical protein
MKMNEQREPKKKKAAAVETPVHTIRAGAVAASIWRRQSPAGYVYWDYSLTRSWESLSSGNTGHSKNFFASNQQDLAKVIEQATRWIADHEQKRAGMQPIAA